MEDVLLPRNEDRGTARDRIASTLRDRIAGGELPSGGPLPSETSLRKEFGVSRGTVRTALLLLKESGVIVSVPSRGWYVQSALRPGDLTSAAQAGSAASILENEIREGQFRPGDQFLSVGELASRFGLTRYTAHRALLELVALGLIAPVQSRGYFVTVPEVESTAGH